MSAFKTTKINNVCVKAVPLDKTTGPKVRGNKLFSECYANVFICAKKKSGKSSLIRKILNTCSGRDTHIVIFCSTVYKDKTYKVIVDELEESGHTVTKYTSIVDGKTNNLTDFMDTLNVVPEGSEEEEEEQPLGIRFADGVNEDGEKERPLRKERLLSPEYILVFDDLSTELRDESISTLLKSNRHNKAKVIISSQYVHDLKPSSIRQIDYMILFDKCDDKKLTKLAVDMDLSIPTQTFIDMYREATAKPYSFLYCDTAACEFRSNFNTSIELCDERA